MDRVTVKEHMAYSKLFPAERIADVTLVVRGDQRFTYTDATGRGNFDAPLTDAELIEKFELYAAPIIAPEIRRRIALLLTDIDQAPSTKSLLHLMQNANLLKNTHI